MSNPYFDQGKQDSYTNNPNPNPPQNDSWKTEQYHRGRQEAEYHKSQQPK